MSTPRKWCFYCTYATCFYKLKSLKRSYCHCQHPRLFQNGILHMWDTDRDIWDTCPDFEPKKDYKPMRVIMFKPQFTDKILSGQKLSAIRPKARCKKGDTLSLRNWEGKPYRSKHKTIMETKCTSIIPVQVTDHYIRLWGYGRPSINSRKIDIIANLEGFESFKEMSVFFQNTHSLPFNGELIYWGSVPLSITLKDSHDL